MEFRFTLRENGMRAAFQLLHMVLEVSIVGDFSEEEIESCILDYLGTVSTSRDFEKELIVDPIIFRPPSEMQFQQVFLKDTDGVDLFQSNEQMKSEVSSLESLPQSKILGHPLFFGITMGLWAEVINSRLFTTVRDSLGLTYDVSFELNLFDRLKFGWYVISVTSTPGKVRTKFVARILKSNFILSLFLFFWSAHLITSVYRYIERSMFARMFSEACIATKLLHRSWTGLIQLQISENLSVNKV